MRNREMTSYTLDLDTLNRELTGTEPAIIRSGRTGGEVARGRFSKIKDRAEALIQLGATVSVEIFHNYEVRIE
jgi:hypothetical protein